MVEINTYETRKLKLIPVLPTGDAHQANSQKQTRDQAEDGDMTNADGAKREQKGETCNDL